MNVTHRKLSSAAALVVLGALAAPVGAASVDCARPSGQEQMRGCAAAAKGVSELRQFLQRTRGIYILYIKEFDSAVPTVAAAAGQGEAPKLAVR
jgi:hypothetical protein